ncbi:hypothetical protein SESBI_38322 [Sesbania bispinosa]|nr:hypothetical protein SESBI_38322 [Sesbania bispinosa]
MASDGDGVNCCLPLYGKVSEATTLQYKEGEVHAFHDLDVDNWSYFEAIGLLNDLGYISPLKLWWKRKGEKVHVYVEHAISEACNAGGVNGNGVAWDGENVVVGDGGVSGVEGNLQSRGKGVVVDDEKPIIDAAEDDSGDARDDDNDYSSDESVRHVHFNDGEEERDLGLNDGFSEIDEPIVDDNSKLPGSSKNKRGNGIMKRRPSWNVWGTSVESRVRQDDGNVATGGVEQV